MQKIGNITSTADANGEWTNGNVAAGTPPTILDAAWLNTVQRELVSVVTAGGLALDPQNDAQVIAALKKFFLQAGNNLSEIKQAGALAQQTAIANLGLINKGLMRFTSSGTFTVPAGVTTLYVSGCGGGGGGGGTQTSVNTTVAGSGGGSGAGFIEKYPVSVTPGQVINAVIGAGGLGGGAGGGNGFAGGSTIFGVVNLQGGLGGQVGGSSQDSASGGAPGLGGAAGSGGGNGSWGGDSQNINGGGAYGGAGGQCPFGAAGLQVRGNYIPINGQSATGYGAGGGGAGGANVNGPHTGAKGGDGASGVLFIEW